MTRCCDRGQSPWPVSEEDPLAATVLDYAHNILAGSVARGLTSVELRRLGSGEIIDDLLQASRKTGRQRTALVAVRRSASSEAELARGIRTYVRRRGAAFREPRAPEAPTRQNLALFGRLLGLNEVDSAVLQFLVALHQSSSLTELTAIFGEVTGVTGAAAIAGAARLPREQVLRALRPAARLVTSGIVVLEEECKSDLAYKFRLKPGVLDLLLLPGLGTEQILGRFLPAADPPALEWSDLVEVEPAARLARDLLAQAVEARRAGVNVLIWGPTGTGKSELARRLAADVGVGLYCAGRSDESGESATARERLSSLLLGHRILGASRALLFFDELEDLFGHEAQWILSGERARMRQMSKQWFNLLLENNPVPTIWITNSTSGMDPAFLRRFTYAVEVGPAGARQRERILRRHLGPESGISPVELETIARRYPASAAQLGSAVGAARLLGAGGRPEASTIERVLDSALPLLGKGARREPPFDLSAFRIDALSASEDLGAVADRLADWRPGPGGGLSICLYGPPGTGKSEYAKYLAHRMGRSVVYRRVSDIMSMWVGQTEQHIGQAFREAATDDSLLLFDEADSFLRDRKAALRSWEVTEVNEFLQQLESFTGVVVCTTNLWHDLDEAALRRFVLKVEFRPLDADRASALFRSMFESLLAAPLDPEERGAVRASLGRLASVTPGDLATVRRKVLALGLKPSAPELVSMIESEVRAKRDAPRAAGF